MKIFENVAIKLVSFKNRNYCLFSIIFFCILHRLEYVKFHGYCDHVKTTTPRSSTGNLLAGHKKENWKKKKKKKKKTEAKTTLRLLNTGK